MRILLVEDEHVFAELIARALERAGFSPATAVALACGGGVRAGDRQPAGGRATAMSLFR